jgi:hypothetical protein
MKKVTILSVNGKRKVVIENIATGIDKRKEAVDIILKNK